VVDNGTFMYAKQANLLTRTHLLQSQCETL